MKKLTVLLLVLCMLFSMTMLSACGSSSTTTTTSNDSSTGSETDDTEIEAEPEDDAADAEEGREVSFVAGIVPSTDVEILVTMMTYLEENLAASGIEFQLSGAMFENTKYIELIENYVTMGADVIIVVPMDTAAIQDAVLAAEAAGTHVVFVSSPPDYSDSISGGIYSDYYAVGYLAGEMACAWAKLAYPDLDEIPVAITTAESDADSISRSNGMRDAIEADEKCYVVYEGYNTTSAADGYDFAQEVMTVYPETRVFVMYESDPAIGVNNYIQAYLQSDSSLSYADFGVFAVGYSSSAAELIEASASDEASVRGVACYSALEPGEPVLEVINAIISGDDLPYWLVEECFTVNGFGFEK